MSAGRGKTRIVTKLHIIRKRLKTGDRYYVYAWRGGPQIHVQDGTRPVITNDILDKAKEARLQGNGAYAGSFDQTIDEYLASPEFDRLADVTKDDYKRWLTRISARFGSAPLEIMGDFRMRKDILAWRDKWADQPRAADRAVGTLSVVLGWAFQRGMLRENIARGLGTLHRADHADEIWEERHWAAVADVPEHIMRVLQLGRLTGMRLGDLLRLEWKHVGPDAIVMVTSKKKVRAGVPIYNELRKLLDGIGQSEGAVLRNSKGQPWTSSGFKSSWATQRPKGFDRRFHDLRGTCATWLAGEIGLSDSEIAGIVGWKVARVAEIRARYVSHARTVVALAKRMNR